MALRRVLHIPDVHSPNEDRRAVKLLIDIASQFKPHEIIYLGDFFDLSTMSLHEADIFNTPRFLKDEIERGKYLIDEIEEKTKAEKYIFLEGNHVSRIRRFLSTKAPQLAGIINIKEMLGIPTYYKYLEYGQNGVHKIGNLIATHGTLGGAYPAAAHMKKYNHSIIHGHTHKLQAIHQTGWDGREMVGISAGWLGDRVKAAPYIKDVPDWQLGAVVTYHKPNGQFWYQLIHINKRYECIFNGEVLCG